METKLTFFENIYTHKEINGSFFVGAVIEHRSAGIKVQALLKLRLVDHCDGSAEVQRDCTTDSCSPFGVGPQ